MKIGITERGDAGRDLSWYYRCKAGDCDGVVVITKTLTPECREKIMDLYQSGFPIILHCTCTGWGGTYMEQNVYGTHLQLHELKVLLDDGFPAKNVVLRVDPIIPNDEGILRAKGALESALALDILPACRVRISVVDMYRHAQERFARVGITMPYRFGGFGPDETNLRVVADALVSYYHMYGIVFETCAEPALCNMAPDMFARKGCISETDLSIMGLVYDKPNLNPQGRGGCLCLGCKTELLYAKHRCPNGCLYCYWKD